MALSPQWSSSVVVRADRGGGEVVSKPTPTNGTARAYAAVGNPIVVRPRDANCFTASGGENRNAVEGSGGGGGGFLGGWLTRDVSETFWVPDSSKNEVGLLEMLSRRGATNTTHVLLQSRPIKELQYNYSTCTGQNIDLSHNLFRLSKTATALQNMDLTFGGDNDVYVEEVYVDEYGNPTRAGGSSSPRPAGGGGGQQVSMSARDFKQSMRASLQSLQQEDYYLVKYRDYSAWATTQYRSLAKTDTLFGKKYVEQCFALHVGREPGELILITESQFLYGVEIMQRELLNQLTNLPSAHGRSDANKSSYFQYQTDINYSALNADQFRSLGALLGDGMRQVHVEGEEKKREEEAKARARQDAMEGTYIPPAWYDWSPGAIKKRVQHQLSHYYTSVGQLTVQVLVIGVCGYIIYGYVKNVLPSSAKPEPARPKRQARRRSGWFSGGDRQRYDDYDDDDGSYMRPATFMRSVLMGPKEVFDYMLAPRSE